MKRRTDERGSAIVEFCWVGLMLFIPVTWIVLSVFEVQRGAFAVNGAARAAARAFALAPNDEIGKARAQSVVDRTLADQGSEGQIGKVDVVCQRELPTCHSGTALITVQIDSSVQLPFMPRFLSDGLGDFDLDATHTVPIGQFVAVDETAKESR